MYSATIPVPANKFFSKESDCDHEELQVKPIIAEPEEEIGAKDDGEGAKPHCVFFSP